MSKGFRPKLSYANVVSTLCLFILLGGAAYAATKLPKNSVGAKQIKKNAVTGAKVKDKSLTGADIDSSTLGTVPKATSADQLGGAAASSYLKGSDAIPGGDLGGTYANPTLKPSEALHFVGPSGPAFANCNGSTKWANYGGILASVGFYRDQLGVVHLSGSAKCTLAPENGHEIFTLPAGYRPTPHTEIIFSVAEPANRSANIEINEGGQVVLFSTAAANSSLSLDGITFRCAPSGADGCP